MENDMTYTQYIEPNRIFPQINNLRPAHLAKENSQPQTEPIVTSQQLNVQIEMKGILS